METPPQSAVSLASVVTNMHQAIDRVLAQPPIGSLNEFANTLFRESRRIKDAVDARSPEASYYMMENLAIGRRRFEAAVRDLEITAATAATAAAVADVPRRFIRRLRYVKRAAWLWRIEGERRCWEALARGMARLARRRRACSLRRPIRRDFPTVEAPVARIPEPEGAMEAEEEGSALANFRLMKEELTAMESQDEPSCELKFLATVAESELTWIRFRPHA